MRTTADSRLTVVYGCPMKMYIRKLTRALGNPILVAALTFVIIRAMPDIEGTLFPIAYSKGVNVVERSATRICWVQYMEKYRNASPEYFSWFAYDKDVLPTEVFAIYPYAPLEERASLDYTAPAGFVGSINQCFDLPKRLQGTDKNLVMYGKASYRVTHRLWQVHRYISDINISKNVDYPAKLDRELLLALDKKVNNPNLNSTATYVYQRLKSVPTAKQLQIDNNIINQTYERESMK